MKKLFFFAATAAIALSSCSSDDLAQAPVAGPEVNDGAVTFEAYTARATRATLADLTYVRTHGFGVFGYDQGATDWSTYSASNTQPNFFYNQKVASDITTIAATAFPTSLRNDEYAAFAAECAASGVSPTDYYAETVDAHTKVTGFADSPLDANTWAALPFVVRKLASLTSATATLVDGFKYSPIKYYNNNAGAKHSLFAYAPYNEAVKAVFALGKAPQIRYNIATDDYDLMWGKKWESSTDVAFIDLAKQSVTEQVKFCFQHALSCVTINAVPFIDLVHGDTDPTLHPEHSAYGDLTKGTTVTLRSIKFVGTSLPSQGLLNLNDGTWTIEGTDESAYEMATAAIWDATDADLAVAQKPIKDRMMFIPSDGHTFKIQVTYDVTTIDPTNPLNNNTKTNIITSDKAYELKAGTAYKFDLDLGLTTVKFDAAVVAWNEPNDVDVDLPNNTLEIVSADQGRALPENITSNWLGEHSVAPVGTDGKFYYNTAEEKLYKYDTSDWAEQTDNKEYFVNSHIYKAAAATPNPNIYDAPRWWKDDTGKYYILENGVYSSAMTLDETSYDTATEAKTFWKELNADNIATGVYKVYDVATDATKIYYVVKRS